MSLFSKSKHKTLLRIISILLVQTFLLSNAAFAGGVELLVDIQNTQQSATLSPQVQIRANQFKTAFDSLHQKQELEKQQRLERFSLLKQQQKNKKVSEKLIIKTTQGINVFLDRVIDSRKPVIGAFAKAFKNILQTIDKIFLLGAGISKQGNIASGNWTQAQHTDLNAIINILINDPAHNKTKHYDQNTYTDSLKTLLNNAVSNFTKEDQEYRKRLMTAAEKQLKQIHPSAELNRLFVQLGSLFNNEQFQLFFLDPRFGEDKFSFLHIAEDGTETPLHAQAHFGHNQTKGKKKQQNIYIARPYFDSLTSADQLGLIVHEMVHLIYGKGDAVHELAEIISTIISLSHDDAHIDSEELISAFGDFLAGKNELFMAVQAQDRDKALESYQKTLSGLNGFSFDSVSKSTVSNHIISAIAPQLIPAIHEVVVHVKSGARGVNQRGVVIAQILQKHQIGGMIGRVVSEVLSDMPFKGLSIEMEVETAAMMIGNILAREVINLRQKEFNDSIAQLADEVIDDVVTSLYDEKVLQDHWRERLKKDIVITNFENSLPVDYFEDPELFKENKQWILAQILTMHSGATALGSYSAKLKKVSINNASNLLEVRSTIKHELIHYLAHLGQIKIDYSWEFTTFSIDLTDKIIHSKGGDITAAERDMALYIGEYGHGMKELYLKGKDIVKNGDSKYILEPVSSDSNTGYFSIDMLVREAIQVYESLGIPTEHLKRYLNYKRKAQLTPFEEEQFHHDQYRAQTVAGIMMAGIFIGEYEQNGIAPIRSLKDYFQELDQIFGKPTEADQKWIEKELVPELETLATQLYGTQTRLEQGETTDKLGLWVFKEISRWQANIRYWPMTLYPRNKEDRNRTPHREAARERAIGNLFLSIYRFLYGYDDDLVKKNKEFFENNAFAALWDALIIPRSIFLGVPSAQRRFAKDGTLDGGVAVPQIIQKVFKDKFDLGNERAEKELFRGYPLHLQFLDSLLYQWSQTENDPRLEPGSKVDQAIRKTFDAWTKVMMNADELHNYSEIFDIVVKDIWPEFKKLFDEDIEIEKNRRLIEQMEEEDLIPQDQFDPNNLTPQQQQSIEDFFNALPDDVKQHIMQQIMQQMQQAGLTDNQPGGDDDGQGMNMPMQGGAGQGQGMPQAQGAETQPGDAGEQSIEQNISQVEGLADQLESMLDDIRNQAEGIGKDSKNLSEQLPSSPTTMIGNGDKGQEIADQAQSLQDAASQLGDVGSQMSENSSQIKDDTFNAQENAPPVPAGQQSAEAAADLDEHTKHLQDKIKQLQDKVNDLVKSAQRLNEFTQSSSDPTQVQQVGNAVQSNANQTTQAANDVSGSTNDVQQSLSQLNSTIKQLAQQIKEYQESIEGAKQQQADKTGDGDDSSASGDETSSAQPESPSDGSQTSPDDASTQLSQSGDTKPQDSTPSPEPLEYPQGNTSLKDIIDKAKAQDEVNKEQSFTDSYEDEEFSSVVDPEWLKNMEMEELWNEMERTGLNEEELREYNEQWRAVLGEDLIDNMIDLFRGFIIPESDVRKDPKKYSGILKKPIKGLLGGMPFIKRYEEKPLPVKVSFIVDISGSMSGDRLKWAKLTMLLLLEVVFTINEELETMGYPPIEFEVGCFNEDTELFISHETSSQVGEDRKERLIYDAIKKFEATGWTDDKLGIGVFSRRLIESPEIPGYSEKARRVMFAIGDGNVNESDKTEIRGVLEGAEEEDVAVFGVSVGDDQARQTTLDAFGKERAIIPQKTDLSDLPSLVMQRFAERLTPPGQGIDWMSILPSFIGMLFGTGSFYAAQAAGILFKHRLNNPQGDDNPLRKTSYRHFFHQTVNGREYLVWQRKDAKGRTHQLRFQCGAGGMYTPESDTVDDDDNEGLMLEILQSMYLQEVEYTSYSSDGKYYVRQGPDSEALILMERSSDAQGQESWIERQRFEIGDKPKESVVGSHRVFQNEGITYRKDATGIVEVELDNEQWYVVTAQGELSDNLQISYDDTNDMYVIYDAQNKRLVISEKQDDHLSVHTDLAIEQPAKAMQWKGKIIRAIGPQGTGKDTIIRAAAKLVNEEVYFVAGNQDMEPEDLWEYQTLGLEEQGATGHLYTAVNHVLHNGGWVVIDEWNKVKPKVRSTLKTSVAASQHQRWVRVNGKEKLKTFDNHSRARVLATANYEEGGVTGAGMSDQALQRRYKDIIFTWRSPVSEKGLQYKLAMNKLKKMHPELNGPALKREQQRIKKIVEDLVDLSWPMRLTHAGYSADQRRQLVADNFKNWKKLLKKKSFMAKPRQGQKKLQRAPSPRVLANIIEHAMKYPSTWENSPWSVVELWFNFYADEMKEKDRQRQYQGVATQFSQGAQGDNNRAIKDPDDLPKINLDESCFKVEGEYLVINPKEVEDNGVTKQHWDQIRVWIHPQAREYLNQHGLPEEIAYWLSINSQQNNWRLYWALQTRALGKSLIFVGEQGTGKSVLARGLAQLLSGPDIEMLEITPDTDKEELTFKAYIRKQRSGYDYGPVAVCIDQKKTGVLEESTQGSPGVLGILNEVIERMFMTLPNGHKLGEEGDGRAGFVHAVNTPGTGAFHVKGFSAELIERHAVMHFPALPIEDMQSYLLDVAQHNHTTVNPRVIGQRRIDPATGNIEKLDGSDQDKWDGLLGVVQAIRKLRNDNPNDKKTLPRSPDLGSLIDMIQEIKSYWDTRSVFSDEGIEEQLLEIFENNFVLEADAEKRNAWANQIEQAFIDAGIYDRDEDTDGLEEFLDGEDMLVQKLPLLRKPQTGVYRIDTILVYLQENTQGNSIAVQIDQLQRLLEKQINETGDWLKLTPEAKLELLHKLRDSWQIIELIKMHRKGEGYDKHSDENLDLLKDLQRIIQNYVFDTADFAPSFLQDGLDDDQGKTLDQLNSKIKGINFTKLDDIDDLFVKIAVHFEDKEFARKYTEKVSEKIQLLVDQFKGQPAHQLIEQMSILSSYYRAIESMHTKGVENIDAILKEIQSAVKIFPYELGGTIDSSFIKDFLELYPFADKPRPAAQNIIVKMLSDIEKLSDKDRKEIFFPLIKNNPAMYAELYRFLAFNAITISDKDQRNAAQKLCSHIYDLGYKAIKSFEVMAAEKQDKIEYVPQAVTAQLPVAADKKIPFDSRSGVELYQWKNADGQIADNVSHQFAGEINSVSIDPINENFIVNSAGGNIVTNIAFQAQEKQLTGGKEEVDTFSANIPMIAVNNIYDSVQTKNFFFFATDLGVYISNRSSNEPDVWTAYDRPAMVIDGKGYIAKDIDVTSIAAKETGDAPEMYIVNSSDHEQIIQKYTKENRFSEPVDTFPSIENVKALSINKDGDLLAAWENDDETIGVAVIQTQGGYNLTSESMKLKAITRLNKVQIPPGTLQEISSIVEDDDGFIYVSGKKSNNILVLKRSGIIEQIDDFRTADKQQIEWLDVMPDQITHENINNPVDLGIQDGKLFVSCEIGLADPKKLQIYTVSKPQPVIEQQPLPSRVELSGLQKLDISGGIDIVSTRDGQLVRDDKSGIVYSIINANRRIAMIMPKDKNEKQEVVYKDSIEGLATPVLALDIAGDLFFTATDRGIAIYGMSETITLGAQSYRMPDFSKSLFDLSIGEFDGIAAEQEGDIYNVFASSLKTGKIYKWSSLDNFQTSENIPLDSPHHLYMLKKGQLLVEHKRYGKPAVSIIDTSGDKMKLEATTYDLGAEHISEASSITADDQGYIYLSGRKSRNIVGLKLTNEKITLRNEKQYYKIKILSRQIFKKEVNGMNVMGMTWEDGKLLISDKPELSGKTKVWMASVNRFLPIVGKTRFMYNPGHANAKGARLDDDGTFYLNLGPGVLAHVDQDNNVKEFDVGPYEVNDFFITTDHVVVATTQDIRVYDKKARKLDESFYDKGIFAGKITSFSSVFVDEQKDNLSSVNDSGFLRVMGFRQEKEILSTGVLGGGRYKTVSNDFYLATDSTNSLILESGQDLYVSDPLKIGQVIDFFENENKFIYVIGKDSNKIHVFRRSKELSHTAKKHPKAKRLEKVGEITLDKEDSIKQLTSLDHRNGKTIVTYEIYDGKKIIVAEVKFDLPDMLKDSVTAARQTAGWQPVIGEESLHENIAHSINHISSIAVDPVMDAVLLGGETVKDSTLRVNTKTGLTQQELVPDAVQDLCSTEHFELLAAGEKIFIRFGDGTLKILFDADSKLTSVTAKEIIEDNGSVRLDIYYLDRDGLPHKIIINDVLSQKFKADPQSGCNYFRMHVFAAKDGDSSLSEVTQRDVPVFFNKLKFSKNNPMQLIAAQNFSFVILDTRPLNILDNSPLTHTDVLQMVAVSDNLLDDKKPVFEIDKQILSVSDDDQGNYYVVGDSGTIGVFEKTNIKELVPADSGGKWVVDHIKRREEKDIDFKHKDYHVSCIDVKDNMLYAGVYKPDENAIHPPQVWKYALEKLQSAETKTSLQIATVEQPASSKQMLHSDAAKPLFEKLIQAALESTKHQKSDQVQKQTGMALDNSKVELPAVFKKLFPDKEFIDEITDADVNNALYRLSAEDIQNLLNLLDEEQRKTILRDIYSLDMPQKDKLEIPEEFVKALLMAATSDNAAYIKESLNVLAEHEQLLEKLIQQKDFFKKLVAYIEKLHNIDQNSFIQRLKEIDVIRKKLIAKKDIPRQPENNSDAETAVSKLESLRKLKSRKKAEIGQIQSRLSGQINLSDSEREQINAQELLEIKERAESLKEKGDAIVRVMLDFEHSSQEIHDKDKGIAHRVSGTSKSVYDFRAAKDADALTVLEYILKSLNFDLFDGKDIKLLDEKRQELIRKDLDITIDNDQELIKIKELIEKSHNTRHTYNVHLNVNRHTNELLLGDQDFAIFHGADSLEILIAENADAVKIIEHLYQDPVLTNGMSIQDKYKLLRVRTRLSDIAKERRLLNQRINELEDEIRMIDLKISVLESSARLSNKQEQELSAQGRNAKNIQIAI